MKTIKQIADEIGVDKQRVYRYINKNHLKEIQYEAGVMYCNNTTEYLIKSHFLANKHIKEDNNEAHQSASKDALVMSTIDMLKEELKIKNEQIRELNNRLAECNAALVAAQQSAQAAQALHAGTIQLMDGASSNWFSRLFKKNKNSNNT